MVTIASLVAFVDEDSSNAKYWVLLAGLPFLLGAWAFFRALQRYDEYARLQQLKGLSVAFGVSILGVFLLGMVSIVGFTPAWAPWLIFVAAMTAWGVTVGFLTVKDS